VTPARDPTVSITHRVGDEAATFSIDAVQLVASVDGGVATDRPVHARKDQTVTLHAVLRAGKAAFSDARELVISGTKLTARPLAEAPRVSLRWLRIEPTSANTSNTQSGSFRFEPIEYRATPIEDAADHGSIAADVHPTLTPDHGAGLGTMRFQLEVTQGTRTLATPGIDARRGRGSGGLTDAVLRVSIRRDDSVIGFMTEMMGQPYVWASAGLSDTTHQSERLEGSDCADLMVYGARRMGKHIAYTWTGGLPAITKRLASGTRGEDGIYRDRAGKPLPYTQEGDLILFPRHVGALTQDKGTKGVLDDQDIILHTLFDSPKEQAIADSGYADTAVEIRRFR
jgi:cell wall-associated NlpC family hydrolase